MNIELPPDWQSALEAAAPRLQVQSAVHGGEA
jgi:hypothetical protein